MDYGIKGKTALVTGAKRGIGYVAAVMFARAGVNTAFIDIDDTKEETEELKKTRLKCIINTMRCIK